MLKGEDVFSMLLDRNRHVLSGPGHCPPSWARIMVAGKDISDVFLGQLSTSVFSNMSVRPHWGDCILGCRIATVAKSDTILLQTLAGLFVLLPGLAYCAAKL